MFTPEIPDDWEEPEEFWQILSLGGFVTNVDKEGKNLVEYAGEDEGSVSVVDIYGDEAIIYLKYVVAIKQWTKLGGQRYASTKQDD